MGRIAAVKSGIDGGCNRRVADAHFADGNQIMPAANRFHAERHGTDAGFLIHRGFNRDIAGGQIKRQIEGLETDIEGFANLVDGRTAAAEIIEHLLRDAGRIGRNASCRDAVIASEYRDERTHDGGTGFALPGCEPFDDFFQTAKAAGWLGEKLITRADSFHRNEIGFRHFGNQAANIIERQRGGGHGNTHQNGSNVSASLDALSGFDASVKRTVAAL